MPLSHSQEDDWPVDALWQRLRWSRGVHELEGIEGKDFVLHGTSNGTTTDRRAWALRRHELSSLLARCGAFVAWELDGEQCVLVILVLLLFVKCFFPSHVMVLPSPHIQGCAIQNSIIINKKNQENCLQRGEVS